MSYEKACKEMYLQKFDKSGRLLRIAEQFSSGIWVVYVYFGKNIAGEYTLQEFKKIKKFFI